MLKIFQLSAVKIPICDLKLLEICTCTCIWLKLRFVRYAKASFHSTVKIGHPEIISWTSVQGKL